MQKYVLGILAHVDSGKTTLTEAMLYSAGVIKRQGRVDKGDAFLDTHEIERERGITVFSKMAEMPCGNFDITLLDTPGHVDFSAETERTLSVLDACILVISATDPIRAHTKTLWQLLRARRIPTFLFVNKTDLARKNRVDMIAELRQTLSSSVIDFMSGGRERIVEEVCGCSERLMGAYFDGEEITDDQIRDEIAASRVFPVYFGSALHTEGISDLLQGLAAYLPRKSRSDLFGLKVYKIARDPQGNRLTYLKVTGGVLRTKQLLKLRRPDGSYLEEKVEGIRRYSGEKFHTLTEAVAGSIVAVLGLSASYAGQGIGVEYREGEAKLEPILTYTLILPEGVSAVSAYGKLAVLAEEDPALHLFYDEETKEIRIRLMGEIQLEILRRLIADRFGLECRFGEGEIVYKETVAAPTRGAGHFEPLRHYAEVHLLIEPLEAGAGIVCTSDCPTDLLSLNWQRLILTHLEERVHRGVLTGSPLTDVKITVKGGRAHKEHTEGGDFRRATYRAVRQALMKAESVLLEPYYDFTVELPCALLGRAMTDLSALSATLDVPEQNAEIACLTGYAPAVTIRDYARSLRAYTKGEGSIALTQKGYFPCHNAEEVIDKIGYDPMLDERNTPNSVFCKAGTGYVVPWDEADALMHVDPYQRESGGSFVARTVRSTPTSYRSAREEDRALEEIFERTYGKIKRRTAPERVEYTAAPSEVRRVKKPKEKKDEYVLVDGYNIIYAWEELAKLASHSLIDARDALVRILSNYAGFRKCRLILVFDAYRVKDGQGSVEEIGGIRVVYTKERQTADAYIERASYDLAKEHFVRVATSDSVEQLIILGNGAYRVSAREFYREVSMTNAEISEFLSD